MLALHDACGTRHEKQIYASVRNILRGMGLEIEELHLCREKTVCCGHGGLMFFANPELARSVVRKRTEQSESDYLAYCAMCRDYLASTGKRTLHLLDLVLGSPIDGEAARRGPGYVLGHEDRARLEDAVLKDPWGEAVAEKGDYGKVRLKISDELREIPQKRQNSLGTTNGHQ